MEKKIIINVLSLLLGLFLTSCSSKESDMFSFNKNERVEYLSASEKEQVIEFESKYVSTCCNKTRSQSDGIVLIGYKTVSYHGEDSVYVNKLWDYYRKQIDATGYTLTLDGKVRIYFRMKDAIILVDGKKYIADSTGVIHNVDVNENSVLEAVGSVKSNYSVQTTFAQSYKHEKLYIDQLSVIFDLGERKTCCAHCKMIKKTKSASDESSSTGEINVSCIRNHPGFPNCTKAFNITTERCQFKSDRCMDYNGFGTDCSGSHLYFVGSDCSKAMALFHCWNELM